MINMTTRVFNDMRIFTHPIFFTILILLSLCSSGYSQTEKEKWSGESVTLYTTLMGFSMIDAKQTFMMDEYRSYFDAIEPITYAHEGNPLMGESPTRDRIIVVKLLSGALTFYGLNKMKEKNRKKALIWLNVFYLIVVLHNNSLGLSINL